MRTVRTKVYSFNELSKNAQQNAIEKFYNDCVGSNDFYKMINRRLKYQNKKDLAIFLNNEFEIHLKEFAQYQ